MKWTDICESLSDIPEPWVQKLRAGGYRRIGRGRLAQVWAKSGEPFVVKIFREDEAYREFVDLITAHQDNPHFPRIRGKLTASHGHYALRIERLARLTPPVMIEAMQMYRQAHNAFRDGFARDTLPSYIKQMSETQQAFRQQHPALADALDLIFTTICDPHRWSVDWTEGNFRLRGKTVVITDPVAW